jgi:hypothetical protein
MWELHSQIMSYALLIYLKIHVRIIHTLLILYICIYKLHILKIDE